MNIFTIKKDESGKWSSDELAKFMRSLPPDKEITISISENEPKPGQSDNSSFESVFKYIEKLEELCSVEIDLNDANSVLDALRDLGGWLSFSGKVKADAHRLHLIAKKEMYAKILTDATISMLSTSERKDYINCACYETSALYERADRANASITHRCEHFRSFLSFIKSEMEVNKYTQR